MVVLQPLWTEGDLVLLACVVTQHYRQLYAREHIGQDVVTNHHVGRAAFNLKRRKIDFKTFC